MFPRCGLLIGTSQLSSCHNRDLNLFDPHTRSTHSALLCACLRLESAFMASAYAWGLTYGRSGSAVTLIKWSAARENIQSERGLASAERRRSQLPFSLHLRRFILTSPALAMSPLDNCKQHEFLYLSLTFQSWFSRDSLSRRWLS